ncbi:unnamed protein product, partial [Thelazia callipaeda]|uniref:Ovule protein n=1 Tax=Thelazia callipaeda TaxID=103827 RepID=A0A0N5DBY0_THECL
MWEGQPIDSSNGWPIFEKGNNIPGISLSTSMVMNATSSQLSQQENHSNSLQYRKHSQRDRAICISQEMS